MNTELRISNINTSIDKEIDKEIEDLDNIKEWDDKINKMKDIKEKINNQRNKINKLIESINNNDIKKIKKKKNLSLQELLIEYESSEDLDEKVKLFGLIQTHISNIKTELFDN